MSFLPEGVQNFNFTFLSYHQKAKPNSADLSHFRSLVFVQKTEDFPGDGRGLEHLGRGRSGWLELKREGIQK
jgi:hypothetical protein